jgi:hypothetical protein
VQRREWGLTTRSTGPATASTVSLVRGTWCIIANQAYGACLRRPVSSNVRPHNQAMSVSIYFDRLFTYTAEDTEARLPLSQLSEGCGHVHGELAICIAQKPLPSLGYFGADDVCLNTWTQELCTIEEALSDKEQAVYIFDEGEQGQPAYEFRRETDVLFVSVVDSLVSGADGDPSYQQVSCLWSDFRSCVHRYKDQLKRTLESEAPEVAAEWWAANARSAA